MKRAMKLFSLLVLTVSLLGISCERHDFESTKRLQHHHGGHDEEAGHAGDAAH